MNSKRKLFDKSILENLYIIEKKNITEIANILKCNPKTITKNLHDLNIKLRTKSEYNALSHKSYTEPEDTLLFSKSSLILHSIYKCEGSNSDKSHGLRFQNQDPNLIKAFYDGIIKVYKYETEMTLSFLYNFQCEKSKRIVELYNLIFKDLKIRHADTPNNKNPIITINAGGKHFHSLFMKNTQKIFNSLNISI